MATNPSKRQAPKPNRSVIEWLLDSDPSIRWQVIRNLIGADTEAVAAERAKVATEGLGAWLLARQQANGHWAATRTIRSGAVSFRSCGYATWDSTRPAASTPLAYLHCNERSAVQVSLWGAHLHCPAIPKPCSSVLRDPGRPRSAAHTCPGGQCQGVSRTQAVGQDAL